MSSPPPDPHFGEVSVEESAASRSVSDRPPAPVQVVAVHKQPPIGKSSLDFVRSPDGPVASSYRILRYRLKALEKVQTLAVTSANPQEGKTSCAVNLAMALAEESRRRILLVEANLRAPRLAEMLGFVPPQCFARQLARHLDDSGEPWQVVAAYFDNLHVLALQPSTVRTVLNARAMRLGMNHWMAASYAHVIVDCSSVKGSADVNVVADTVDAVLMVAMAGRTKTADLVQAKERLGTASVAGTVVMNCQK